MSLLELDSVEVVYERRGRAPVPAVVGASLRVEPGEIVGLVGESGCGKSSLARAAVGLTPLEGGGVTFEGRELSPLTRRARPAVDTRLQLVFQNPFASLNPRRRVGAQIDDAAAISRRGEGSSRRARVDEVLRLVDLPADAARRYPRQFSGGQRQRVALARALAAEPSLLVLDEPFASLDASAQAQLANLLVRLTADLGLGLLLISHDLAIVRGIASRVYVMYLGKVVEHASTAALWDEPLHPYTEALIAAMPRADGSGFMPDALAGEVPDPSLPPSGCRFHPRCPAAFEPCDSEVPPLERVGGEREVACWLRIPAGATQDGPASTRSAGRGARTGSG